MHEKIFMFINNCEKATCPQCGKQTRFESVTYGYRYYCSDTCANLDESTINKSKKSLLEKYGVDNPFKLPENIRAARLRRITSVQKSLKDGHQISPIYNPAGCQYFNQLMLESNTFIQHAENGGEYYIKELGYWVDGYDKENNIVYEYDEDHHFAYGKICERDLRRQQEIENLLGCKFIRINARNKNKS